MGYKGMYNVNTIVTIFLCIKKEKGVKAVYEAVNRRYKAYGFDSPKEIREILYSNGVLKKCGKKSNSIDYAYNCGAVSIVIDNTINALENERREISGQIAKLQLRGQEIDKDVQSLNEAQILIRRLKRKETLQ